MRPFYLPPAHPGAGSREQGACPHPRELRRVGERTEGVVKFSWCSLSVPSPSPFPLPLPIEPIHPERGPVMFFDFEKLDVGRIAPDFVGGKVDL